MPDIDAVFQDAPRDFYDHVATSEERRQLDAIIVRLCAQPALDGETRFRFGLGDDEPEGRMYNDGRYWIIYHMINDWTLEILGIGTVGTPE